MAVFNIDDNEILGMAAWAMGEVGFRPAIPLLEKLRLQTENVQIYVNGDFCEKPLSRWVDEALIKIRNPGK